jgi:hypothetical protein
MDIKIKDCSDCKLRTEGAFVYCALDDEVDIEDFDSDGGGVPDECPLKKDNVTFML